MYLYYVHSESKKLSTKHSFITLTNVGRFSKFCQCRISHHTLKVLVHYLAKYKIQKTKISEILLVVTQ